MISPAEQVPTRFGRSREPWLWASLCRREGPAVRLFQALDPEKWGQSGLLTAFARATAKLTLTPLFLDPIIPETRGPARGSRR